MSDLMTRDVRKEKRKLHDFLRGKRELFLTDASDTLEVVMLTEALKEENRVMSRAAKRLGISRSRLYRLLYKHEMLKRAP